MKSPVLPVLIFFLILTSSCSENDDLETYLIEVSGTVTDQETGTPVEGAAVISSVQRAHMPGTYMLSQSYRTLSGPDGSFFFKTQAMTLKDVASLPIGSRGYIIAVKATKDGYSDATRKEISYYNGKDAVVNIELIK